MASEVTQPPNVDVDKLTDNDPRALATLDAQSASSLKEVIWQLEMKLQISELKRKVHERDRERDQSEFNACKQRLQAVEDELQQTKCELGELKSSRADIDQRSERAETRLKAAERLLGEYVLKIDELEAAPVPGPLTRMDASAATSSNQKRARSPSLEMVGSSNSSAVRATSISVKKSLESASSLYSKCNAMFPPRSSESQASCLPNPAKRRKVGTDDEVIDIEMDNGSDLESNRPSDTTSCANDTATMVTNVSPHLPVNLLSSDAVRTETPLNDQEITDPMDVEATGTDPGDATGAGPSHNKLSSQRLASSPGAPLKSKPVPPTPVETSINSIAAPGPSQPTTTAHTLPGSTSSTSTTNVGPIVLPGSSSSQTTIANAPPPPITPRALEVLRMLASRTQIALPQSQPPLFLQNRPPPHMPTAPIAQHTLPAPQVWMQRPPPPLISFPPATTGAAPITTPNVPTSTHPGNAARPAANVIPDLNPRTTKRALPTRSKTASACRIDEPPVCATSTTPKSNFLDTSTMPPPVASMIQQYLPGSNAKNFPIFPSPRKTEVPRAFLVSAYGGASRQWLQIFRKDKDPKGAIERRVVFPQFGLNPAMPSAPGHPGLIFASRHEILDYPPWTVFRKGSSGSGKAVWLYLGDYECELVGKMTEMEFSGLATSVKHEWAKALLTVKQFGVYVSMRARIALRKHGCIPVEDKKKEEALIDKEIDSVKANNGRPVDARDIIGALERGDERIDIIRMICIKYDHAFAKDMKRKFIDYKASLASASTTSEPSSSGKKTAGASASASTAAVANPLERHVWLRNNTSRRHSSPFDEEESDTGGNDWPSEEDAEFQPPSPMVPSDRRLRPRTSTGEVRTSTGEVRTRRPTTSTHPGGNEWDLEEDSESGPRTPLSTVPSDRRLRFRMRRARIKAQQLLDFPLS